MATIEEPPSCGICGNTMVRIKPTTEKKQDPIYLCNTGKSNARMPCDGFAYQIALKNS